MPDTSRRPSERGGTSVSSAPPPTVWARAARSVGTPVLEVAEHGGRYLMDLARTIRGIRGVPRGSVLEYCVKTGVEAVPILIVIGFLMGLILAMQASVQLKPFGATIYVANLVGVAMVREIGPLITGVLVAGRSASGFAAEVGSAKINEEVSALTTMGLDVHQYLFTPKFLATAAVVPALALLTEVMGILGGFAFGVSTLHIGWSSYLAQTRDALHGLDLVSGMTKAFFYGAIIALVGTAKGMRVERGPSEVGDKARSAVVLSIVLIVITDFVFTAIFHAGE